jgi:hypothetical protein
MACIPSQGPAFTWHMFGVLTAEAVGRTDWPAALAWRCEWRLVHLGAFLVWFTA